MVKMQRMVLFARPGGAFDSLRRGDGTRVGSELFGFDDEDDGAGVGFEDAGFVRPKYGAHSNGEVDCGAAGGFYRGLAVDYE
jgi:hypothetical protein